MTATSDGGFLLACENFRERLAESFPFMWRFYSFWSGSVHSDSASKGDRVRTFPGEFRVSSLSRRAPTLCLDSQPVPTSDSDSDSELYCPRTEILGNSLFLQSVLSKLLKKQNPKNKKIRTQILTDTIDEHNIIKRHNSLLILQIHTVS